MITKTEAIHLAGNHFKEWINRKYSHITFLPMKAEGDTKEAYLFTKTAQEWLDANRSPRTIMVMVNKYNGKVFDDEKWQSVFVKQK